MNQNNPFPENREPLADHGADPQRLAEIEQRLKAARPRPPELDAEAIVRSAQAMDQSGILPGPSPEQRETRRLGWIVAIAGSWACGAIAGALLTFILLSRDAPLAPSDGIAAQDEKLPMVKPGDARTPDGDSEQLSRDEPPWQDVPPWSPADSLATVMSFDSHDRGVAPYGDDWPTLKAGALARNQTVSDSSRLRYWTSATPRDSAHTPDPGSDALEGATSSFAPAPSITQEQLLRELLGVRPDSVL